MARIGASWAEGSWAAGSWVDGSWAPVPAAANAWNTSAWAPNAFADSAWQEESVAIVGASALFLNLTITFAGSGTATQPQQASGSGAFVSGNLAAAAFTGTGLSVPPQIVSGSGAFSKELNASFASFGAVQFGIYGSAVLTGGELAAPVFAGVGASIPAAASSGVFSKQLAATFSGVGLSQPRIYGTGGTVDFTGPELVVTFSGTGAAVPGSDITGSGAFAYGDLTATFNGTGLSVPPQQVTGFGSVGGGLQLETTFAGVGLSLPAGAATGSAVLAKGLVARLAGYGAAIQPQAVTGTGAGDFGTLTAALSGIGTAEQPKVGVGSFTAPNLLRPTLTATGLSIPPGPLDLGWEDDEATWGGVQLTSKNFTPVFITGTEFSALGFDATVALDTHIERLSIIHEDGAALLGLRVWPQLLGPTGQTIQISLGASFTPEGEVDWEGPYDFTIGTDESVDFAVAGKYLAIRFASTGVPGWTLQSYSVDYEVIGVH